MTITKEFLVKTENFVQQLCQENCDGHDWWHVHRVRNIAIEIAEKEPGTDRSLTELIALLHDVDDWKHTHSYSMSKTREWLFIGGFSESDTNTICKSIHDISFKGAAEEQKTDSPEARAVQDADRLDAMGAIGIARTFAFGGSMQRSIYDPGINPVMHASESEYRNNKGHTINHFYEKLLLLKDRMNTQTAKEMAIVRHNFMLDFLTQFYKEWNR